MINLETRLGEMPLERRLYALRSLPKHLATANKRTHLRQLLADFSWMQAKLDATDVNALITDYDRSLHDSDLHVIRDTIRLCAHVLSDDRTQLAGQLLCRLSVFDSPTAESLLTQVEQWHGTRWLRPYAGTLTSPGGPL